MIYTVSHGCRKPFAASSDLQRAKNDPHQGDMILMIPIDIRQHDGLMQRFSEGKFLSFYMDDGYVRLASDYNPDQLYASVMRVKSLTVKPYTDLSAADVSMIERNCPGFEKRQRKGQIAIHPNQIVSLVRVNPDEALHFTAGSLLDVRFVAH